VSRYRKDNIGRLGRIATRTAQDDLPVGLQQDFGGRALLVRDSSCCADTAIKRSIRVEPIHEGVVVAAAMRWTESSQQTLAVWLRGQCFPLVDFVERRGLCESAVTRNSDRNSETGIQKRDSGHPDFGICRNPARVCEPTSDALTFVAGAPRDSRHTDFGICRNPARVCEPTSDALTFAAGAPQREATDHRTAAGTRGGN
jgi:hypothetical protein